jgi:putative transposase
MYDWQKMSDDERKKVLHERKSRKVAWHSPPRFEYDGNLTFIVTAACYEHKAIIGTSTKRLAEFEASIIEICNEFEINLFAWCILPNHYHLLLKTNEIKEFQHKGLGKLHGQTSYNWNKTDNQTGRKVWYRSFERQISSTRHFWASLNYIHHNATKHGYVNKWQDWLFSSANKYLENFGREKAQFIWHEYPILDYGKDWDIF